MALTILCLSFLLFLILGVPVAFAIGLSAVCTILYEGLPVAVVFQRMTSGMTVFSFLAIPFFIFAGELMLYGGIADRIVTFAKSLVGHIRGGLGMSNVVACTLFGGVSGSPVADVSAMGAVMIPMMKREGYAADYAVNVTTHASLVGALMPTSHNMIIYSLAAGGKVSIAALILAGVVPALILTLCNLAAAYAVAVKRGYPAGKFPGWDMVLWSFVAVDTGSVRRRDHHHGHPVGRVHRDRVGVDRGHLRVADDDARLSQPVVGELPQGGGEGREDHGDHPAADRRLRDVRLSHQPLQRRRADRQGDGAVSTNPWAIFFLVNLILFVLGTFLDMAATILICTPIFLPICMTFGMDPVQFGMVMLINCALGLNTPPVGTTQFVGCAIGGVSIGYVMRTIWPFYGALIAALMLVTYVPAFSLWLPKAFGYLGG